VDSSSQCISFNYNSIQYSFESKKVRVNICSERVHINTWLDSALCFEGASIRECKLKLPEMIIDIEFIH
jgi:hypothetical protein